MTARVWPLDAVTGAPAYSGRGLRQTTIAPWAPGATVARPLGARSGIRPGSYSTASPLVTATSTQWTLKPHAGVIDAESAAEAAPYAYALDANATGAVTAANATYARVDIVWVRIDDPAEGDGSSTPAVVPGYTAGTAGPSPTAPATPARAMVIAQINVPASGGGSPTVTMVAPSLPLHIIPVRSDAERTALDATGATTLTPVLALQADSLWRHNGTAWALLARPITDTAPVAPTLNSGWTAWPNATYQQPSYALVNGFVELGGLVFASAAHSVGDVIFNLLAGFRPSPTADTNGRRRFPVLIGGNVIGGLEVRGNGDVTMDSAVASGGNVALDGIRFRALG